MEANRRKENKFLAVYRDDVFFLKSLKPKLEETVSETLRLETSWINENLVRI